RPRSEVIGIVPLTHWGINPPAKWNWVGKIPDHRIRARVHEWSLRGGLGTKNELQADQCKDCQKDSISHFNTSRRCHDGFLEKRDNAMTSRQTQVGSGRRRRYLVELE